MIIEKKETPMIDSSICEFGMNWTVTLVKLKLSIVASGSFVYHTTCHNLCFMLYIVVDEPKYSMYGCHKALLSFAL